MFFPKSNLLRAMRIALVITAIVIFGCDTTDQRLVQQAETASQRQAEQNRQIAHQNHQIAEATNRLVEADAKARQETLSMQHDLQKGHNELEAERLGLAAQRNREPIIAAVLSNVGLALACLLPLVLCWYLLHGLRQEPGDRELSELLISEFATNSPRLLPPPVPAPAAHSSVTALPAASSCDDDRHEAIEGPLDRQTGEAPST